MSLALKSGLNLQKFDVLHFGQPTGVFFFFEDRDIAFWSAHMIPQTTDASK
jgi:hypothetical protein